MANIPEETLDQINAAVDIVDVITSYGIDLKRAGSSFKACCPFHNERTPSFNVSPQRNTFHCFGCGAGGGVIGFVMQYENVTFMDAVKKLAQKAGVTIEETAFDPKEDKKRRHRSRLIELHNNATEFMHTLLMKSPDAAHGREYLKSRGFGKEMAQRWKIGWMPNNSQVFTQWAKKNNYTGRELIDSGLAGLRNQDNPRSGLWVRFNNRLMFPIHNDYGDVVAFSGRQLIEDPNSGKYINSPETIIFNKSKIFFGLDKARRHISKEKSALLCEGQIDAISCVENGIENAIAPLGTAFTEHHARLLKRYTSRVILCFDADSAGYKAIKRAHDILVPEGIHISVIKMPDGEDPDSLIKAQGVEAFRELMDHAMTFFDFIFEVEKKNRDLNNLQDRTTLAGEIAQHVAKVGDKLTREALIQEIAARLKLGAEEFRGQLVNQERKQFYQDSRDKKHEQKMASQSEEETVIPTQIDRTVASLCSLALHSSDAQVYLCEQLEALETPLSNSHGGHILKAILAKRPVSENAANIQTFFLSLNASDQLALVPLLNANPVVNPQESTEEACSLFINSYLQKREAAIRTALASGHVSDEETNQLLREAQEISTLLKGVSQRFIR